MTTEPRTYLIGLPVVITVHPDGRVEFDTDLSEAADAAGREYDPGTDPALPDDVLAADAATIQAAVNARRNPPCPSCCRPMTVEYDMDEGDEGTAHYWCAAESLAYPLDDPTGSTTLTANRTTDQEK